MIFPCFVFFINHLNYVYLLQKHMDTGTLAYTRHKQTEYRNGGVNN